VETTNTESYTSSMQKLSFVYSKTEWNTNLVCYHFPVKKKIKAKFAICNKLPLRLVAIVCISIILVVSLSLKKFLDSHPDVMLNRKSNAHTCLVMNKKKIQQT
jgi:hypothetical protein